MASVKSILRSWDKKRKCGHKEPHQSQGAAEAHKRSLLKRDPDDTELQVYRCPYSVAGQEHWHVGHRRKRK